METNETWCLQNETCTASPISMYRFTPAGVTAKRFLFALLLVIGGFGFLGNCLLFFFLWKKPVTNFIHTSPFMRNLRLYIRSLSLSDIFSCAVSLPLILIQIFFDIFQSGWPCKIVRFFNFVFPAITMNNLVVISIEKYLSTRTVPRTFSVVKVRRMIICAWALGALASLLAAAPYDGIRVDLEDAHYTVICFYKENFYPFRITLIAFPLQYILPSVFITYANICLIKTLWVRRRKQIHNATMNVFRASMRAVNIKGIALLIALTFSFIVPYIFYFCNIGYTQIAKPQRDFSTSYLLRYGTGAVVYFSGALNFIVCLAQMKDFRDFIKKLFQGRNRGTTTLVY